MHLYLFSGQSIVLTSHSLVECDILCDKIAIMVQGDILCKDSPGALREKYGSGYKINLKINEKSTEQKVNEYVKQNFSDIKFIEHKYNWLKYRVKGKISSILTILDTAKSQELVESFTIDVASLEDIFLQITQNKDFDMDWSATTDIESGSVEADKNDSTVNVDEVNIDDKDVPEAASYDPPKELGTKL